MYTTALLQPEQLEYAVELLKEGKIIAFPTETVYGLGAPLFHTEALREIFRVKGRPADNPLIAHVCDFAQIQRIAYDLPPSFFSLAEVFFPGPLTLILKKHPAVPSIVSGGKASIALRMPRAKIAQTLIAALGEPLAAPSANLSGKPSATTSAHVLEDFEGKIAAVIEGGATELGLESTVLSLLHNPPRLLRPGIITKEQLEEVLHCKVEECIKADDALSPGMKYRHYAPRTPIRLLTNENELLSAAQSERFPLVLTRHAHFPLTIGQHHTLSAHNLYALFRYADAQNYSCILVLCDEPLSQNRALKNRLLHATTPNHSGLT